MEVNSEEDEAVVTTGVDEVVGTSGVVMGVVEVAEISGVAMGVVEVALMEAEVVAVAVDFEAAVKAVGDSMVEGDSDHDIHFKTCKQIFKDLKQLFCFIQ